MAVIHRDDGGKFVLVWLNIYTRALFRGNMEMFMTLGSFGRRLQQNDVFWFHRKSTSHEENEYSK